MFRHLLIALFFGALLGASTSLYSFGLEKIQEFHRTTYFNYTWALVIVFGLIQWVKRSTLFFPIQVLEVVESSEVEQRHWSSWGYVWNLIGSWLSHLAGASLGREGTVLVLSSNLAQICKLNWTYYKPIVIAAAFSCVVGQPLIAAIFMLEVFVTTSAEQKIFATIMAWVGFLVMQSLGVHSLFSVIEVDLSAGFWDKIWVILFVGASLGLMANGFKRGYHYLAPQFKKQKLIAAIFILILSGLFVQPLMKPLHSLSLDTLASIQNGHADVQFVLLKTVFTLLFVSLGFIGGDFVPAIAIGSGMGVLIAQHFQVNFTFGLAMGLMAFFTGLTRLKWTSLWIIFFLAGFKVTLWAYLCLSITRQFSGGKSLYKKELELI